MEGAPPKSPLVVKGVSNYTLAELRQDAVGGRLPQVSWVVAPYKYSEHPKASPTDGAHYISLVLDALTANPEVWRKTVFIINYDENDGLFDHIVPPMPPSTQAQNAQGLVSDDLVESLQDELIDMDKHPREMHPLIPGADPGGIQPIGLGPRLPMLILSPWTKGGWVCSEVFDHTSVLRFLEARFGVMEPNISKWRRTVCGDLTSAFDFSAPDTTVKRIVPPQPIVTSHEPYHVPEEQSMPEQEPGTRPARALPYEIYAHCRVEANEGRLWIDLDNAGKAGAVFYIYSTQVPQVHPRRYTVSPGQKLADYWPLEEMKDGRKFSVFGPNGYLAEFACDPSAFSDGHAQPEVMLRFDSVAGNVHATLVNTGAAPCMLTINNYYASVPARDYQLVPGAKIQDFWVLNSSSGWFDLAVTQEGAPGFLRRFAGHVENGKPSVSDPGVAKMA